MSDFRKELASLINKHSKENGSNTPDFILVEYLDDCLKAYDKSSEHRERWHTKIPVDQIEADELKFESDDDFGSLIGMVCMLSLPFTV